MAIERENRGNQITSGSSQGLLPSNKIMVAAMFELLLRLGKWNVSMQDVSNYVHHFHGYPATPISVGKMLKGQGVPSRRARHGGEPITWIEWDQPTMQKLLATYIDQKDRFNTLFE